MSYMEYTTQTFVDGHTVRVHRPVLTEDEKNKRIETVKKSLADFVRAKKERM